MAPAAEMLAGGTVLALGSLLNGERLQHWPTPEGWLALLYLVVFGSLVAFSAYLYLLKTVRPALATLPTLIEMALVLGILAVRFDIWFAVITLAALVFYIGFTVTVTEWRTRFRKRPTPRSRRPIPRPLTRC